MPPRTRRADPPAIACARVSISLAARRVNVRSRIRSGATPPATSDATRAQSVVVLPVPAPARTSRWPPRCCAAARCSGFSSSSQSAVSAVCAANIRSPNATVAPGRHAEPGRPQAQQRAAVRHDAASVPALQRAARRPSSAPNRAIAQYKTLSRLPGRGAVGSRFRGTWRRRPHRGGHSTRRGGTAGGCRRSPSGLGLAAFGVYAFVVALLGDNYRYTEGGADYLSPFYSPDLSGLDVPFSSAFLVIWVPLAFRATCYYYRKAYYRAYFMAPPACAVASPRRRRYRGRGGVAVHPHERAPVLPVPRHGRARVPVVRRDPGVLLRRRVRGRARVARAARQRDPAVAVHVRLQLGPAPGGREDGLLQLLGPRAAPGTVSGSASAC